MHKLLQTLIFIIRKSFSAIQFNNFLHLIFYWLPIISTCMLFLSYSIFFFFARFLYLYVKPLNGIVNELQRIVNIFEINNFVFMAYQLIYFFVSFKSFFKIYANRLESFWDDGYGIQGWNFIFLGAIYKILRHEYYEFIQIFD